MKQTVECNDFSLGLHELVDDNLIDDREVNDVQNAVLGKGFLKKRNGYSTLWYVKGKLRATYSYIKGTGERGHLVLGDQLAWWTGNGFSTLSGMSLDEESEDNASFVTMKDRAGVNTVLIANHRSLCEWKEGKSSVSSVEAYKPNEKEQSNPGLNDFDRLYRARHMTLYGGRLFMAAHPTMKNRVSFSHIDPTLGRAVYDYFPAVNFFDLGENDEIVGLVPFRSSLLIFCRYSVWALFGEVKYDFKLMRLNTTSGCIAPKSIRVVEDTIFYLGDSHVYALFSNDFNMLDSQIVSTQVRQTLTDISETEKQKAAGVFYDNKYYVSFPNGTTLVYDILLKAWTRFTNVQANAFLVIGKDLVFGGNHNRLFRFNEGYVDDNKPIPFLMRTKRFD
ncbi:hypothetical protein, partial [Bacillus sp. Fil]|uniref:hypothetical protein n=1 Tax=Bacillus sp. Fil TaxID=3459567 RepID=UPI00403A99B6